MGLLVDTALVRVEEVAAGDDADEPTGREHR